MNTRVISKGFTLVEILVVLAIISILAAISAASFKSMYQSTSLRSGASATFDALTSARSSTLGSQSDMVYGVHFSSTTVTQFAGDTYVAGATGNSVYTYEGSVRATSSVITSGGVVTFSRLQGLPSTTGTLYVYDVNGGGTTTVIIHGSGLIEYN